MRKLKSNETKILLLLVAVVLVISFLAAVVLFASQPVTVKVEYWLGTRTNEPSPPDNVKFDLVNLRVKLLLQGCDSVNLNFGNFTLNGYPCFSTSNYPFTLYRNQALTANLAFEVPADTVAYTLTYHGISNCTFVFTAVSE